MEDARPDIPALAAADPPLTCVHATKGLCAACRADYEEDPLAWLEFGAHPEGIANWQRELARIAADMAQEIADRYQLPCGWSGDQIPF